VITKGKTMIFNFLKRIVPRNIPLESENLARENSASKTLKKGFSIIELLIVLAIGAGIIVVALGYRKFINTSREQTTEQKMANIDTMLEFYRTKMGSYPTDLSELVEGPTSPALRKKWGEALANESDLKDSWFNELVYEADTKGNKYELYSTGSKGESKIYSPASREN